MKIIGEVPQNSGLLRIVPMRRPYSIISPSVDAFRRLGFESWKKTRNSAIAEGLREALGSRNPATTKHLT